MKTLYFNGDIITMEDDIQPEAVLCEDGTILAVGYTDDLKQQTDLLYNLKGKTLMPAFIDSHSHFITVASTMAIADLSHSESIDELINILREFVDRNKDKPQDEFIIGFGYDNNFYHGKKHPDRYDLDKVSMERPIIISHASGHMGVCNTRGLEVMGITENTPDPAGGHIGRDNDNRLTGYLEETAFTANATMIKQPDYTDMCRFIQQAENEYFRYGIGTIQDGFTGVKEWSLLKKLSDENRLTADVVCYVDINNCPEILEDNKIYNKKYIKNLKIGGYKLFLDGSPQGRTAWMSRPYENSGDYKGYPVYTDKQVQNFVIKAISEKQQLLTHCNGDAASQQLIDSYIYADNHLNTQENHRPVMVHCQLTRPDQMPQMEKLGMTASFFPAHIWQWGDVHLENFGRRGMKISPVNSAVKNNINYTFHQDSPVLPPDMLHTVWCAVNKVTAAGEQLDKSECVSVYEALKAITINAAYQYGEENKKGSIAPGKDASFVILSHNPLKCDVSDIDKIKIEQTILKGETVYSL